MKRRNVFAMVGGWLGLAATAKPAVREEEFPASERFKLLYQRLQRAEGDAERREVSLAGCSVAAMGGTKEDTICHRDQWAWHPAYQDVLDLRRKFEAAMRLIADWSPSEHMVALYPCGCSASGPVIQTGLLETHDGLPRYCSEHDSEKKMEGACSIVVTPARQRPTIAELEELLAQDPQPKVQILPSGHVITI